MSSDEDDYMNFDFSNDLSQPESYQKKRQRILNEQMQKSYIKPKKVKLQEDLNESLALPLPPENKGFKLLSKMGYKPGMSLGKQSDAIVEPIGFTLKSDKQGIGLIDNTVTERVESIESKRLKEKLLKEKQSKFVSTMSNRYEERQLIEDLEKLRNAAMDMDEKHDVKRNDFWPPLPVVKKDFGDDDYSPYVVEEEENEFENKSIYEQFELVNDYIRSKYYYCIWCGIVYNDNRDLKDNCPGDSRDDHDEED
ncbi:hypothetical protein BC833DRAFT_619723 [Globomyces pollinis-pini]|nr:hypothetical protein BC833DRAFT_619723 [Globomyces pollinis-pini]